MQKKFGKIVVVAGIIVLLVTFQLLNLTQYLSLSYLKMRQGDFAAYYETHGLATVGAYFLLYVLVTAFSLPGAVVMTLAGGALFGFSIGMVTVSFASTVGATLAFLVARFLLHDVIEAKFSDRLKVINEGILRDGAFYLFTLRLVPIFPFFIINLLMGLTSMRVRTFYWVSQIGMLLGTAMFVNAGTQLAQIESVSGILSPRILGSFVLVGILPFAARKLIDFVKVWRLHSKWPRPKIFD